MIALKSLLILVAICLAWPHSVSAVCLDGYPTVEHEFRKSVFVFVGRVTSEEFTPESKNFLEGSTYMVLVEEILKGSPPKSVRLFSENSSGRFLMNVGSSYLIFVYEGLGRLVVNNAGTPASYEAGFE